MTKPFNFPRKISVKVCRSMADVDSLGTRAEHCKPHERLQQTVNVEGKWNEISLCDDCWAMTSSLTAIQPSTTSFISTPAGFCGWSGKCVLTTLRKSWITWAWVYETPIAAAVFCSRRSWMSWGTTWRWSLDGWDRGELWSGWLQGHGLWGALVRPPGILWKTLSLQPRPKPSLWSVVFCACLYRGHDTQHWRKLRLTPSMAEYTWSGWGSSPSHPSPWSISSASPPCVNLDNF